MFNFDRVCRCCMTEAENESELYEFASEIQIEGNGVSNSRFVSIITCYNVVTTIKILKDDEEISRICPTCLQDLKTAYVFRIKSLENEKKFRRELIKIRRVTPGSSAVSYVQVPDRSAGRLVSRPGPTTNVVVKQEDVEIKEENEYIEYIDEEYLDPVYLNDGINNSGNMPIDGGEETFDEDEYVDDEYDEDFVVTKPKTGGTLVKRDRIVFRNENDEDQKIVFNCAYCPKSFGGSNRNNYYRRHFRRLHMTAEMENCEAFLRSEDRLDEVHDLQLYQCAFCGKIDLIKSNHEEHMATHDGQGLYKCKKCEIDFPTREELKQHISIHPELKRFMCDICGNSFKNRYALTLHNRSHTGEKPFKCPICDRGFSMASNMQKHIDSHSDARPYACEVCGQFCKTPRSLKFHIICFHKTEMKIKCPDCDKSFVNKSYLKMHQQYHTGEKRFTCTICQSKYYKSSHLKRHIQHVHFKMRLLKCEFCASDFVRKETYRTHVLNHHKNVPQEQLQDVLERIKNFKPPPMDVDQYTMEKQNMPKGNEAEIVEVSEIVEEDEDAYTMEHGEEEEYDQEFEDAQEIDQEQDEEQE